MVIDELHDTRKGGHTLCIGAGTGLPQIIAEDSVEESTSRATVHGVGDEAVDEVIGDLILSRCPLEIAT